jgi:hypothetical protein
LIPINQGSTTDGLTYTQSSISVIGVAKKLALVFILLISMSLIGCWTMSIPSDKPGLFSARSNEVKSLIGATTHEVTELFGQPEWIAHEDNATYYIYQWRSTDKVVGWFLYVPIPLVASFEEEELHCILLKFGRDDILKSYKIDSEGISWSDHYVYSNCPEVFGMKDSALRVQNPGEKK